MKSDVSRPRNIVINLRTNGLLLSGGDGTLASVITFSSRVQWLQNKGGKYAFENRWLRK